MNIFTLTIIAIFLKGTSGLQNEVLDQCCILIFPPGGAQLSCVMQGCCFIVFSFQDITCKTCRRK